MIGRDLQLGDFGFTMMLDAARAAGHITADERRQWRLVHFAVVRAIAAANPDGAGFLAALDELVNSPVPAVCRYPDHRPTDWLADAGRLVCGECHPPAGSAAPDMPSASLESLVSRAIDIATEAGDGSR